MNNKYPLFSQIDVEPRAYQRRVVDKALQLFAGEYVAEDGYAEDEATSILIESPTGSGKTVMALEVARQMQLRYGYSVGYVAMRRNLLDQAAYENQQRGFNVDMALISMFDKNPPQVDFLVVDEAQHDAAMSMSNLHAAIQPKKILGTSATPFRGDRLKLCFDQVISDINIQQLIAEGYLAKFHHYTVPNYTPDVVAKLYLDDTAHWGKSLIFFYHYQDCVACQQLLTEGGIRSEIVSAKSNQAKQLKAFMNNELDVLINMNILTEGFNCPELKTVFCRPSSKLPTIQMAGRALRMHPDMAYKQIVQCQETRYPFMRSAKPTMQYIQVNSEWRSLSMNPRINNISDHYRRVLATKPAVLPVWISSRRSRSRFEWLEA